MKNILYWLLGLSLATLWIINFFAGIVGGIWLIVLGNIWFVVIAVVITFIMPYAFSLAMLPSLLLAPLITKAVEKENRFFTALLGLLMGGYNNFLLAFWATYVFGFVVLSNDLPLIPALLFGYAITMGPISSMARGEGPDAGTGTTFGVLFVQISYFILAVNILLGGSPDSGYACVWLLLITYTIILTFFLGVSFAPKNKKGKQHHEEPIISKGDGVFCTSCGKSIDIHAAFCKHCGVKASAS